MGAFLDINMGKSIPYPVNFRSLSVPIVFQQVLSYREGSDIGFFLDFENATLKNGGSFTESYNSRPRQRQFLVDFEAAVYDRMSDSFTCAPELFNKAETFSF